MSPDVPTPDVQATTAVPLLAGRYHVLDKLGQGGMGAVFHARDAKLDRHVAIKILPAGSVHDADAVARFRREARALARLSHSGIIQAHDSGEDGDRHFLVMEFVAGHSLARELADKGRVAPTRAADYAHQAALALHHAHQHGLVHRDVKPSNLLVTPDGRVKLLDLGLARFLQDQLGDATVTREGTGMGTPDYAAPEQFRDAHHADPRADVYSLGCTLYHLIAGGVPFPGSSLSEKVKAHETKEAPPLEAVCPDMPAGLALAVRRMMAKRPADRFQSMAEVAEALAPYVATSSPSFPHIRTSATWDGSRLAPAPRRRRAVTWLVAGVLLLAGGMLLGPLIRLVSDKFLRDQLRSDSRDGDGPQAPPGEPKILKAFGPDDALITQGGVRADDGGWRIHSNEAPGKLVPNVIRLHEFRGPVPEDGELLFRAKMRSRVDPIQWGSATTERAVMPPPPPGDPVAAALFMGFKSQTRAEGATGWAEYEVRYPLHLRKLSDTAAPVELNLCLWGTGDVWIKDVDLLHLPAPHRAAPSLRPGEVLVKALAPVARLLHTLSPRTQLSGKTGFTSARAGGFRRAVPRRPSGCMRFSIPMSKAAS
jgi:serine/threonine protein kinase